MTGFSLVGFPRQELFTTKGNRFFESWMVVFHIPPTVIEWTDRQVSIS